MKKQDRKQRISLTLLVNGIVMAVTLSTLLLVMLVLGLLLHFDVIATPGPLQLILIFAASCLVLSTVIAFFMSRIPLAPVNVIINHLNRLADGDFKSRVELGAIWAKHPSIAELLGSLNRLSEALESTEMLRSDFINNFSHEFKTPIVSIAGFAKLLRRGNPDEAQREEYLSIIEEESLRLSDMATNVLALTRVENQTILSATGRFNLSEQLRSSILLLAEKWEKKDIDFALAFGEHYIEAEEELLKQVWINLLDNAVKFSPAGGQVKIGIDEQADSIRVSITNSGGEISPDQREHIFNKFYQAYESHAGEGNGIGLAIVKRVVELHGGRVWVDCADGCSCFSVELPKGQ